MNTNAKKWVDALLSGEFKQGKGSLRRDDIDGKRYCCLGVACELFRRETGRGSWDPADHRFVIDRHSFVGILPPAVQTWLGLNSREGCFKGKVAHDADLTALNDMGETFERIAWVIQSEPEGLFKEEETT